ncbi:MAG: (2Fe-2S) ferredoxin domain-containing protein [Cyanobacteria bacterium P01_F01_bin.53]
MSRTVLVCKNTTCSQQGSAKVLAALQSQVSQSQISDDVVVKRSGCLGECGNGPMVLVTPENQSARQPEKAPENQSENGPVPKLADTPKAVWYSNVYPADVPAIVFQHLQGGKIVRRKLYPKYHPTTESTKGWFVVFGILFVLLLLIAGMLFFQSPYGHAH